MSKDILTSAALETRMFKPTIIETKEQLLVELKKGNIKTSKYHLLSEREKLFVEMVAFGDYSAEQAVRAMTPGTKAARSIANRMLANQDVADTLEELSITRNKKFMAEVSSARDKALNKLVYIMNTTNDEAVAAACAKTILDKAEKAVNIKQEEDNQISGVTFKIESVNINKTEVKPEFDPNDKVIIDLTEDEIRDKATEIDGPTVDPRTNISYKLHYETEDLYTRKDKL